MAKAQVAGKAETRKDRNEVEWPRRLGAKRIPDKMEADFAKALPRFSCVSLRESSSFETIKPYLSPDATTRTDIDPTLLLSAEDWEHIAPERQGNPGYVFVYWLGSAKTLLSVLDALSKTRQKSRIKLALNWDYLVGKTMKSERISPSSFVKPTRISYCSFPEITFPGPR